MADEDVLAERARLEALAWGAGSSPDDAARARLALTALDAGRDQEPVPEPAADPTPGDAAPLTGAPDPAAPERAPADRSTGGSATDRGGRQEDVHPTTAGRAPRDGRSASLPAAATTWRERMRTLTWRERMRTLTWRERVRTLTWRARPRVWVALGAAAVVGLAFAAGTLVGTSQEQRVAAASTTPTPGSVTLEELLDIPQTYADQLPGPVEAPVSLRSTRLVFTNRALDGSSFETPWNVWAGVGTDRETICLVATANRLESTTACYPRDDALHGNVSLSAQSMSGTLTITLRGGGVQGTVTNEN